MITYTYYPDTNTFSIPAPSFAALLRRITTDKAKIDEEDRRENARRILLTAP